MSNKRLSLYMNTYQAELDLKNRMVELVAFPTGLCTLLIGAIGYFITKVDLQEELPWTFALSLLLTCVALAAAILNLWKSYFGYSYSVLPCSGESEKYYNELVQWETENAEASDSALGLFEDNLIKTLIVCNDINANNNTLKATYMHKANLYLMIAMIGCGSLSIIDLWPKLTHVLKGIIQPAIDVFI